ncbi:Na+/H+ antiporter NhaC family protein [Natronomonas salina]|uniref:Na+/H+ antiporter NhaC family protein n=1 Tax=Natronomonas salina TaxID=1710540 RepID=UPI0015B50D7A|nr:Na+/H+ antiporter NhaC family protein [Natronomonas salina]QLD89381.1 Na+/H+ antiporter NhaC family protein [Natronomonas salina]
MSAVGAWSLVPPLLAIALAIVTRQAVLSLFLGVWSGGVISRFADSVDLAREAAGSLGLGGGAADAVGAVVGALVALLWGLVTAFDWLVQAILVDDGFHVEILLFTLLLGSAVAFVWRLGGAYAVRDWALQRLDTQRQVGIVAWVLGLLLFFDDYANTAIVGSSVKEVSDNLRVSREKLSYIVDSTAAPVATLGISSWVAFQLSLIGEGYAEAGVPEGERPAAFEVFLQSIPYNMYAILAIVMVAVIVLSGRDFGEMLDAEHRAWTSGLVNREDARPMQDVAGELGEPHADDPRLASFFVPIAVLVAVTLLGALWTGYAPGRSLFEMVVEASYASALIYGSFAMVVSGFVLAARYGIMDLGESVDTTIDGFGIMLTAVSILVLAWSIGVTISELETGTYVAELAVDAVDPALLPAVVMLVAAFIAFSTGTSWGTMGIVTPIALPVAWSLTGDHTMMAAMVGVVFSGAIFGDHASPISDTTVLSATFTGADLVDHVRTQLYYAATVAAVAVLLLLTWGFGYTASGGLPDVLADNLALLLLPVGVVLLVALVYGLSELDARRKGVEPVTVHAQQDRPAAGPDSDD